MKLTSVEKQAKQEAKRVARQAISSVIKENRRNKRVSEEDRLARAKHRKPRKPIVNVQPVAAKLTLDQLRNNFRKSRAKLALQPRKASLNSRSELRRTVRERRRSLNWMKSIQKLRETTV